MTIKDWIKAIGAFSILLAAFMAGFTISNNNWSSSNASLQIDLSHAREERDNLKAELDATKSEFIRAKTSPSPGPTISTDNVNETTVRVLVGMGEPVFNGALTISVTNIQFKGDPLSFRVEGSVGAPETDNVRIDQADVGYVAKIKSKKDSFEVRVVEADPFGAKFTVTRIQSTSASQ